MSSTFSKYQNSYFLAGSDPGQSNIYSFDSLTYTENTFDMMYPGYGPGIAISSSDINEQLRWILHLTIASNGLVSPVLMIVRNILMNIQTSFDHYTTRLL